MLRVTPEAWLAVPPPACVCTARCLPAHQCCQQGNEHTGMHPWDLRYCPSSLLRCTARARTCVSCCSSACAGAATRRCEGPCTRGVPGGCQPCARAAPPHTPPCASSSSVYPRLAPDKALLSPLPRMPAPAPVTQLLKVAGGRLGLRPACLFLLLTVLVIAQREHHVPSIRGRTGPAASSDAFCPSSASPQWSMCRH